MFGTPGIYSDSQQESPLNQPNILQLIRYAVKVGDFQWVQIPPGQSVARPEATRATQEVTNALKYSGVTGHF